MNPVLDSLNRLSLEQSLYIAGGCLILLLLLYLRASYREKVRKVVAFESGKGQVQISQKAVIDLIRRVCLQVTEVEKCHPHLKFRGKTLHLEVHIQLRAERRLGDIKILLDEQITRVLQDRIGLEHLGKINVVITRLIGEPPLLTATPKGRTPPSSGNLPSDFEEEEEAAETEPSPSEERTDNV